MCEGTTPDLRLRPPALHRAEVSSAHHLAESPRWLRLAVLPLGHRCRPAVLGPPPPPIACLRRGAEFLGTDPLPWRLTPSPGSSECVSVGWPRALNASLGRCFVPSRLENAADVANVSLGVRCLHQISIKVPLCIVKLPRSADGPSRDVRQPESHPRAIDQPPLTPLFWNLFAESPTWAQAVA